MTETTETKRLRISVMENFGGRTLTYAGMPNANVFSIVHYRTAFVGMHAENLFYPTSATGINIEDNFFGVDEVTPEYLTLTALGKGKIYNSHIRAK